MEEDSREDNEGNEFANNVSSGMKVPHARVKRIMSSDTEVQRFSNATAIAVGNATVRVFLMQFI